MGTLPNPRRFVSCPFGTIEPAANEAASLICAVLRLDTVGSRGVSEASWLLCVCFPWLPGARVPQLVARRSDSLRFAIHVCFKAQASRSSTVKAMLTKLHLCLVACLELMNDSNPTYTHGHHDSVLRSHNNRSVDNSAAYFKHELKPGFSLLDIGSGPGTITADFATRLAPGRVTAVEATAAALELTRAEVSRQRLGNVGFVVGDVHALKFPDASFDIVHAHQVLQHVGNPVQALREMKRVCKPGGIVAARDADYAGFIWYPQVSGLDEWMRWYQHAARANGGEPNAGRCLLSWAQRAGFTDITATSSTWCLSTPKSRNWWGGMWAERILQSKIADQLLNGGIATKEGLEHVSRAWRDWADAADGWISIVHGEILCRA